MVYSDNQLDQYFHFVKDMLLEEVRHPFCILNYVNQNFLTIQGLDKGMQPT